MRVTIKFDSASTAEVRALCVALHRVGRTGSLSVGVEGPECWGGETPKLTPSEAISVACALAGC